MRNITRRDTLAGTAAAFVATAVPAVSSLAAQKEDRYLKSLWRTYLKALGNHSVARERLEAAIRAAGEDVLSEIEAIDARLEVERNKPHPKAPTAKVFVEGVALTREQLESLSGVVSMIFRSNDQVQEDISVWAKREKERLWREADRRHNMDALDEQQDRLYKALESIEQDIMAAKAHTVEGAAIKLSLAAVRARDGRVGEGEVLAGYEALLEVTGLEDFAASVKEFDPCTDVRGTLSPYLIGQPRSSS